MIQAFYSGAIGAQQQMKKMEIQGNNIANVNTYGYKNEQPAFGTLMYGMVNGVDGAQLPKGAAEAASSQTEPAVRPCAEPHGVPGSVFRRRGCTDRPGWPP